MILVSSNTCWFNLVIIIEEPLGKIPSENVVVAQVTRVLVRDALLKMKMY